MTLDSLGRAAAETLTSQSAIGLQPDVSLARLEQTRRHRSQLKVGLSSLTVVAVLVTAFVIVQPARQDAAPVIPSLPLPTAPTGVVAGNGPLVVVYQGQPRAVSADPGTDGGVSTVLLPAVPPPLPESEVAGIPQIRDPHWSGDGRYLVYIGGSAVRAFDATTGEEQTIAMCQAGDDFGPGCAVDVSADGRSVVVADGRRLLLVDRATGSSTTITSARESWFTSPTFSPDATRVAFLAAEPPTDEVGDIGEAVSVRIVGVDGSGMRMLYATGGHDALSGPRSVSFQIKGLDWSPDGQRLATLVWTGELHPDPGGGGSAAVIEEWVTTIPVAGGDPVSLFDAGDPCQCFVTMRASAENGISWSPDGAQVAVVVARGLVVADASPGAEPRVVLANERGPEPAIQTGDGGSYYDTSTWWMASSTPAWQPVP